MPSTKEYYSRKQSIINQHQLSANSRSTIGQVESELNIKIWYTMYAI